MIGKQAFANMLDGCLKNYSEGLDKFEKGLAMRITEGWLVHIFDSMLTALTDSFFDETDAVHFTRNTDSSHIKRDCPPELKRRWSDVNEILYHYCFNSDFGNRPDQCERLIVVTDEDKNEVSVWNADCAEELYDAIYVWLNNDSKYHYSLDLTTRRHDDLVDKK